MLSFFYFWDGFMAVYTLFFYRISTKMNSPDTMCPMVGGMMLKAWAHYAQGLGNQCSKGGHTMPKAWATFIPWFVRDIR